MKKLITLLLIAEVWSTHATSAPLTPDEAMSMHHQLKSSMDEMRTGMSIGVSSNDADVAFAAGMVPHHQGAVDMAKIELEYGKDPEMRALAKDIISSQEKQINQMNKWLSFRN